jgi:hypothetical protein
MRMPSFSTATCADPRTCPAGWKVTSTPSMPTVSPSVASCRVPVNPSPRRSAMIFSVSGVAMTEPWPGRAWSEWPWVISARRTGFTGSM